MTATGAEEKLVESTLNRFPDWRYLLREFYQIYRYGSAGGSARIRAHQKEVRHRLSRALDASPPLRFPEPHAKPVCAHLPRAIDRGQTQTTSAMTQAIERIRCQLHWEYGYDKVPAGLSNKYAFCELMGPRGPVVVEDLILGLVLFAPGTTYPTHSHKGITESYVCLSGAVSENEVGVYAPGSLILNPPDHLHRITSGDHEPCLLAYAWVGTAASLAGQHMVFRRPRKTGTAVP
jgi:dimethylpropiothetin dethiomethylase